MIWYIIIGIVCLLLGFILGIVRCHKKYPKAGVVLVDLARDAEDTISIQSPKNISHWHQQKGLYFDVEVRG